MLFSFDEACSSLGLLIQVSYFSYLGGWRKSPRSTRYVHISKRSHLSTLFIWICTWLLYKTALEGKLIVCIFCSRLLAATSSYYWRMTIAWDFMALGDQFFIRSSPLSCHITRLLCAIKILCYGFLGACSGSSVRQQLRVA